MKALIEKYKTEEIDVTGLCMLYPTCVIHTIEAQSVTLYSIVNELLGDQGRKAQMTEAGKVIMFTEDIGERLFKSWGSAFVHEKNMTEMIDPITPAAALTAAIDVSALMRKIANEQAPLSVKEVARQNEALEVQFLDVPVPDVPLALLQCDDIPSLQDFMGLYDSSMNADLDSEVVWPVTGVKL